MASLLAAEVQTKAGEYWRIASDERGATSVPVSIDSGTQNPGGYGPAVVVVPRVADLIIDAGLLFALVIITDEMNRIVHEGRIRAIPQVDADFIRLELEPVVAELAANKGFRFLGVHQKFDEWTGPSVQRQLDRATATQSTADATVVGDPATGQPALKTSIVGEWDRSVFAEGWFDSPLDIGELYFAWKKNDDINSGTSAWSWVASLAENVDGDGLTDSAEQRAAGPSSGRITGDTKRAARVRLVHNAPGGGDQVEYSVFWTALAPYGTHGLPLRGEDLETLGMGLFGSDVLAYVIRQGAPAINVDESQIEQSTLILYHVAYLEAGTVQTIVEDITKAGGAQFEMNDWGVYEDQTFFHTSPGTYGQTWYVSSEDFATPLSDGPDADSRCEGVFVTYRDGAGKTHTAGPVGSGADYETDDLRDTDAENPAVGTGRIEPVDAGVTSPEGAVFQGQVKLKELNQLNWRGSINIVGGIRDEAGNVHEPWEAHACDRVVIVDDPDRGELPIVQTGYSHNGLSARLDVGAVPHQGEVFLSQLATAATRAGV